VWHDCGVPIPSKTYHQIREEIATCPLVDCHDHVAGRKKNSDIIEFVLAFYLSNDFWTAIGQGATESLLDATKPLSDRWDLFRQGWEQCQYTGYGAATRRALRKLFGSDEITLENLEAWSRTLPDFSRPEEYDPWIQEAGVVASISDNWPTPSDVWQGSFELLPRQHLAISLPDFHAITSRASIEKFERAADRVVTSLDEYVALCGEYFERWIAIGAVAMKDQSAYERSLDYGLPAKADAERLFNRLVRDERYKAEYNPHDNPLSDYLFHSFMRLARDLKLPVQLHTGHMAGPRNDVAKANARGLQSVLELHRDVRFDLFHGNWPYMGDLLFLAKNYRNAAIDMCWAYAVDPIYSRELLKRSVLTVPFTHIHGFGSDVPGSAPHLIWAYAESARDVIAGALADLVDEGHLQAKDALGIARSWLIENPQRFFGIGHDE
jgi:predicted TIM-barrel fold metal-dependent hydrolase